MNHGHTVVSVQTSLLARHTCSTHIHTQKDGTHTHTQKEMLHLSARGKLRDKNTTGNCHIFFRELKNILLALLCTRIRPLQFYVMHPDV